MKELFKISLAFVGIVSATIATSSNLKANDTGKVAGGYCRNTTATCGRTAGGTTVYGTWTENATVSH
ncbi:MAG: hypothetical protein LBE36_04430 [Flavobacteriaceae bacterium]|jgi:hypothetical protein|nr:hypothetical protein [Flavobacteriaceae bacterium]